uniref:Uncharacterized protein n=1 Tax=Oryza punctata TaxID=4537 RepID=A0A0E0JY96_ORYPU
MECDMDDLRHRLLTVETHCFDHHHDGCVVDVAGANVAEEMVLSKCVADVDLTGGKDLDSGLCVLLDEKVCQYMIDCIVEVGVAEVYAEEPIVIDVSEEDDDGSDYELEMAKDHANEDSEEDEPVNGNGDEPVKGNGNEEDEPVNGNEDEPLH